MSSDHRHCGKIGQVFVTIVTHLDLLGQRNQEWVLREGLYTCSGALPHSPKAGAVLDFRSLPRRGSSEEESEPVLASLKTSTPSILFIRTLGYQSHLLRIPSNSELNLSSLPLLDSPMVGGICWVLGAVHSLPIAHCSS